jgi:hypothetical protein
MVINLKFYLNKQLELRNDQVLDLNDRLDGLQQAKEGCKYRRILLFYCNPNKKRRLGVLFKYTAIISAQFASV